jgi:hypothetical protein
VAYEPVDEFFDTAEFAETATLTVNGSSSTVLVVFDNPYSATEVGDIAYQNRSTSALVKTADSGSVEAGDTLTVGSTVYNIMEVQDDGTGITRLTLSTD